MNAEVFHGMPPVARSQLDLRRPRSTVFAWLDRTDAWATAAHTCPLVSIKDSIVNRFCFCYFGGEAWWFGVRGFAGRGCVDADCWKNICQCQKNGPPRVGAARWFEDSVVVYAPAYRSVLATGRRGRICLKCVARLASEPCHTALSTGCRHAS